MGYMTEVGILNDRWDEIRREPAKFVEQLYESCQSGGRYPGYIIGQTTVAKTHHADDMRVYLAHQNSFTEAYPGRDFDLRRLKMHRNDIDKMRKYLKMCDTETTNKIVRLEAKEK